jgi:transposase
MIISGDAPVSKVAQRFEVFTGAGKRREWPPELKASIVAECCPGRGSVSAVARRHGLDPSQIYAWRKDVRKQREAKGLSLLSAEPEVAMFVPALIGAVTSAEPAPRRRSHGNRRAEPVLARHRYGRANRSCHLFKHRSKPLAQSLVTKGGRIDFAVCPSCRIENGRLHADSGLIARSIPT